MQTFAQFLTEDHQDKTADPAFADHTKNPFHEIAMKHGLVHQKTKHFKNNAFESDEIPDSTAHHYAHPASPKTWALAVTLPHNHTSEDHRRPHVYHKKADGSVDVHYTPHWLDDTISNEGVWKGKS